jgi:hypothetical protein
MTPPLEIAVTKEEVVIAAVLANQEVLAGHAEMIISVLNHPAVLVETTIVVLPLQVPQDATIAVQQLHLHQEPTRLLTLRTLVLGLNVLLGNRSLVSPVSLTNANSSPDFDILNLWTLLPQPLPIWPTKT